MTFVQILNLGMTVNNLTPDNIKEEIFNFESLVIMSKDPTMATKNSGVSETTIKIVMIAHLGFLSTKGHIKTIAYPKHTHA
uniref:Uncharacterized protein n=1 Tax=Rhizophora mucronata TaxID=61149 RepID=A0A2P2KX33_RHIMU